MTNDKETAREIFRQHVLAAMDKAAREIFGPLIPRNSAGATDGDLPRLFAALDEQVDVLAARYETVLYDVPEVTEGARAAIAKAKGE